MAKQKGTPAGVQVDPADPVQQARTRARHRLVGAAVLLVIGIVAFPLVFETAPRPVPVDLPIDIPRKDAVPPLAMPASRPAMVSPPRAPAPDAAPAPVVEATPAAAAPAPPVVAPPSPLQRAETASAAAPRPSPPPVAESRSDGATAAAEAAKARAILEARELPASAPGTPRFVVQVGAFADAAAARKTRGKVERLGLRTYTQVADTAQGSRIRVRVGPFASRDEADSALGKAKAAGIQAVVLTL